jgi:hypothetical protein
MAVDPGPSWADIMTAIGTVAVAAAAVWIALWSDRRTGTRLEEERAAADVRMAEERKAADARLAEEQDRADERVALELERSDKRLLEERAAADARLREELDQSGAQLREERLAAQLREQLAEAYLVQVTPMRMEAGTEGKQPARDPDDPVERAVVVVVNHGHYTIIRLDAQLCMRGNSLVGYGRTEHLSSYHSLPGELRPSGVWEGGSAGLSTLSPTDLGMRYTGDVMATKFLVGCYPVIRWQDRWGSCWEQKQGVVKEIKQGETWKP